MSQNYCEHCLPTKRKSHLDLKIDYYFDRIRRAVFFPLSPLMPQNWKNPDIIWIGFLHLLNVLGAVEFVSEVDPEQILNRSLIILNEAKKRGIQIEAVKIFGNFKNEFRYKHDNLFRYFETNPLVKVWDSEHLDQKIKAKEFLARANLPVPEGKMFKSSRQAYDYGLKLGFPLAVKPNAGSLGHHATYPVNTEAELKFAIDIARQYRPDFIVEKYLPGGNYRATVIGKKHVLVSQKDRPNVIGDGVNTIEQLIVEKNRDPRRGDHDKKNQSLFWITITPQIISDLAKQGLDLKSIPRSSEKIYLTEKYIPGSGYDIIDLTSLLHPRAQEVFRQAAETLRTDLVGFDFICEDVSKSPREQVFGIIEANSSPYIDMHAHPSIGQGQDVAKLVWDTVFGK